MLSDRNLFSRALPARRRGVAFAGAFALLGMIMCGEPDSPATVKNLHSVEKAIKYATAILTPAAGPHEIAASMVWFMATGFSRTDYLAEHSVESMLRDRKLDPLGAGMLLSNLLTQSNIAHQVILFTDVPNFGWYLLIEVNDRDGDHIWDPYGSKFSPDYDGLPASLKGTLASELLLTLPPNAKKLAPKDVLSQFVSADEFWGTAPRELAQLPHQRLKPNQAAILKHAVDFETTGVAMAWGAGDGSSQDVWSGDLEEAQMLVRTTPHTGDSNELFGQSVFAHQFYLAHLVPGEKIVLQLTLVAGRPEDVLVSAADATLSTTSETPTSVTLEFAAAATQASVTLGAAANRHLEIDALQWSRP